MIKPGIKVGPKDWLSKFENTQAKYCEIWYRVDKPQWYTNQFKYIKDHHVNAGLHYWGIVGDGHETNIAYPGSIQEESIRLIKQSIDEAARHSMHYVNIHGGSKIPIKINLDIQQLIPDETMSEISEKEADQTQKESAIELNQYALQKGVLFLIETVPAKLSAPVTSWEDKSGRQNPTSQKTLPSKHLLDRAISDGIHITNDLCHTFSEEFDKPLDDLWQSLWDKSVAMAPYTKLLHINTVIPPYNGTDSHNGITQEDFSLKGIFPTKEKLIQLLSLFSGRDDVWAINEPSKNHEANYFALKNILENI